MIISTARLQDGVHVVGASLVVQLSILATRCLFTIANCIHPFLLDHDEESCKATRLEALNTT